ncbi:MAG: hypothetical protein J5720_08720 [Bacteroidaceae bacterium]|nr:hypothetical protein [Bacteroidaceae bacterium]
MKELSVSESVSQGWEFAKQHGLMLAVFVLILYIVNSLLNTLTMPADFWDNYMKALSDPQSAQDFQTWMAASTSTTLGFVVSIIIDIIQVIFYAGFTATVLKLVRGTMEKVSFDGWKMSAMTYLKYFAVIFIVGLVTVIGLFLCILPGIFIGTRLAFADWYILDHPEAGIGDALKASWNMTSGNFWSVLGMIVTEAAIVLIGFMCCCIGVLFAIPFACFVEGCAYKMLNADFIDEAPVVGGYVQNER